MAQATLLLMKNGSSGPHRLDVMGLREQLSHIPELLMAEVSSAGPSTVYVTVTARNQRERDKLKEAIDQQVDGWHVIEESGYSLPRTF